MTDLEDAGTPPLVTRLYQNSPNPFNPSTAIKFDLANNEHVALKIYNVAGRLVRTLVDGKMVRGRHSVEWNGRGDSTLQLASGIYIYKLEAGGFTATRKLVLMK